MEDHDRGLFLPPQLIVRDARSFLPDPSPCIDGDALPPRLIELAERLGLSDLECAIMLLAGAASLQPRFEHFFMFLNDDVQSRGPSVATAFQLAGRRLDDAGARSCLRADRALRSWGLVELSPGHSLLTQVLSLPERMIAYLLGDDEPDPLAARLTHPIEDGLVRSADLPQVVVALRSLPVVLRARAGSAGIDQALQIAHHEGRRGLLILEAEGVAGPPDLAAGVLRTCVREALLQNLVLCLDARFGIPGVPISDLLDELAHMAVPSLVLVGPRSSVGAWQPIDLARPDLSMRARWWQALRPADEQAHPTSIALLDPADIVELADAPQRRRRAHSGMGRLHRVEPAFRLADVVLDSARQEQILALLDRARYRNVVLDEWAMRPGGQRGRGVTALFAGPPGTGKTMAAEALAGELLVPLFVVELAAVVDKYIGETEKNLEAVFAAVEHEDGVLLFDEADALFGKRSEVSDARDRYANVEVAYLLQRMESFDGLAILTTNMKANLDAAFLRRLDAAIEFAEPDALERRRLWMACLVPVGSPLPAEDIDLLSDIPMSGGAIRSVCVSAAYWAAARDRAIDRQALMSALHDEWRKSGRLGLPRELLPGWGMP